MSPILYVGTQYLNNFYSDRRDYESTKLLNKIGYVTDANAVKFGYLPMANRKT